MDAEYKKLLSGGIWALNATDNKDPDATDVSPSLVRTTGFPSVYSQSVGGVKPDRRRINQLLRELSGAAFEVRMGVSPYDADVNYPVDAITQVTGSLYRAKIANGPTSGSGGSSNAISPTADTNGTTWERVTGSITEPSKPRDFIFDNSQANLLDVKWKNDLDGGSRIVRYDFQYRIHDDADSNPWTPASPIDTGYAQQLIGPLTAGVQVEVRARAITEAGDTSQWGMSTASTDPTSKDRVRGNVPGGGNTLALLARQQGALAALNWVTPSDGGFPITRYIVQWREDGGSFSASNQNTTSPTNSTTISGLSYDTLYYFRVAAENSQGRGDWSNIAQLSLVEGALVQPTPTTPAVSSTPSSFTANARWSNDASNPTAVPTSAIWEWRASIGGNWQTDTHTQLDGFTRSGLSSNTSYQVRCRLQTTLGTTGYSPVATIRTSSNAITTPPGPPGTVSITPGQRTGIPPNVSMRVSWGTAPENGLPIVGYDIRWTWSGGSFNQSAGRNATSISSNFRQPSGTRFTVLVRARRNDVAGPWASTSFSLP